MKVKPWQIAIIVIGLLVGIGSGLWTLLGGGGPEVSYSLTLVDVETGDLFEVADYRETKFVLPAARPGSEARALLPVEKDADGSWYLTDRGLQSLGAVTVPTEAVDEDSGRVDKVGGIRPFGR